MKSIARSISIMFKGAPAISNVLLPGIAVLISLNRETDQDSLGHRVPGSQHQSTENNSSLTNKETSILYIIAHQYEISQLDRRLQCRRSSLYPQSPVVIYRDRYTLHTTNKGLIDLVLSRSHFSVHSGTCKKVQVILNVLS